MESPPRQLTEARIRELIAGLPAFYARLHKHDRTKRGKKPIQLPAADGNPVGGTLFEVVAGSFSTDPADVAFYADMMRMQEIWAHAQSKRETPRARVDAAIASLRAQTGQSMGAPGAGTSVFSELLSSRLAELESYTDAELEAVARLSTEIGIAFMSSMNAAPGVRRRRSQPRKKKEEPGSG